MHNLQLTLTKASEVVAAKILHFIRYIRGTKMNYPFLLETPSLYCFTNPSSLHC